MKICTLMLNERKKNSLSQMNFYVYDQNISHKCTTTVGRRSLFFSCVSNVPMFFFVPRAAGATRIFFSK